MFIFYVAGKCWGSCKWHRITILQDPHGSYGWLTCFPTVWMMRSPLVFTALQGGRPWGKYGWCCRGQPRIPKNCVQPCGVNRRWQHPQQEPTRLMVWNFLQKAGESADEPGQGSSHPHAQAWNHEAAGLLAFRNQAAKTMRASKESYTCSHGAPRTMKYYHTARGQHRSTTNCS